MAFTPSDWRRVEELLGTGPAGGPAPVEAPPVSGGDVASILSTIRATVHGEAVLPAGPLSDQLLDLWSVARGVGPAVARPVELFLSALAVRQTVPADQLDAVLAEVEGSLGPPSSPVG